MAPPRHQNPHHHTNGASGSPFPPLGLAATAVSAISSSPLHSASTFPPSNGSNNNNNNEMSVTSGGDSSAGLPPAPQKVDASQAQACRLQDAYWSDEEVSDPAAKVRRKISFSSVLGLVSAATPMTPRDIARKSDNYSHADFCLFSPPCP